MVLVKMIFVIYECFERKGIFRTDASFFESVKDVGLYEEVKAVTMDLGKQNKPWMLGSLQLIRKVRMDA